ncbi:hypothetical protein [Bradyrhizobium sp. sBnM-33]|uniref:hypothetical protein n=1 Tax=Bradyrhizobium sp. sBnM-33 TaxID=2831780 RepID=UPI001BCC17A8|nr:hypothetical protein [Bradyrhizobium sp. sBnM-33]WOH53898.1 hypothetical protein RX328_18500 [Bradyrhizobium sp. sBnM-33]
MSDRFPLITEAAMRNRISSFAIDGEAVLLGIRQIRFRLLVRRSFGWMFPGGEMSERKLGCSREFDEPIALADGGKLATLRDAARRAARPRRALQQTRWHPLRVVDRCVRNTIWRSCSIRSATFGAPCCASALIWARICAIVITSRRIA